MVTLLSCVFFVFRVFHAYALSLSLPQDSTFDMLARLQQRRPGIHVGRIPDEFNNQLRDISKIEGLALTDCMIRAPVRINAILFYCTRHNIANYSMSLLACCVSFLYGCCNVDEYLCDIVLIFPARNIFTHESHCGLNQISLSVHTQVRWVIFNDIDEFVVVKDGNLKALVDTFNPKIGYSFTWMVSAETNVIPQFMMRHSMVFFLFFFIFSNSHVPRPNQFFAPPSEIDDLGSYSKNDDAPFEFLIIDAFRRRNRQDLNRSGHGGKVLMCPETRRVTR